MYKPKYPFMTKIIYGHATSYEIESNVSKNKYDLVVVGAKGKSTTNRLFLGSVSNYLMQTLKIPGTIVK